MNSSSMPPTPLRLLPVDLATRRAAVEPGGAWATLADALQQELLPLKTVVLQHGAPIPQYKARLTRQGGRCPHCGRYLDFDFWRPDTHPCPVGHGDFVGHDHDRWWAMNAHLWLAERAVHAAALAALRGEDAARVVAESILGAYAARYAEWPDQDNVLGPTRLFFSTYLESIWLLNLCHALDLLEAVAFTPVGDVVRERLLTPSSECIASYHEGRSNRQAWNEVAVLSAWTLLARHEAVAARLAAPDGLLMHFRTGLQEDGTWYEGENYHQFAHRGLWYGVQLLRARGTALEASLDARWHEGFVAPFAGLLPDDTFPSRRDSQYAVSARQWRFAEWCELGYAHRADRRLAGLLTRLYDGQITRVSTARARSSADAERNEPAMQLTRASCSWRALLLGAETPVPSDHWEPASVLQTRQGLAVLRREQGRVYAALDGGDSAGGHGHPDRLALTLQTGAARWLDDPGAGSYVDPTLHWYRSTLAHHAPLINGASQQAGTAWVEAWEDRGGAGWVRKHAPELAPGVSASRTLVVADGYLVDVLEWEHHAANAAEGDAPAVTLTLPLALDAHDLQVHGAHDEVQPLASFAAAERSGAGGVEDGCNHLRHVEAAAPLSAGHTLHFRCAAQVAGASVSHDSESASAPASASAGGRVMQAWYAADCDMQPWRAEAPAAPGHGRCTRLFVDLVASRGRLVGVWSWSPESQTTAHGIEASPQATRVTLTPAAADAVWARVQTTCGTVAAHGPAPHGWHIGLEAGGARSSIDLEGLREAPDTPAPSVSSPAATTAAARPLPLLAKEAASRNIAEPLVGALSTVLDAAQYRRTEEPWGEGNTPEARVELACTDAEVLVRVHVRSGHPVVVDGHDPSEMPYNPLDNERADVNADGLQCYWGLSQDAAPAGGWHAAVLAVPLPPLAGAPEGRDAAVRITPLVPGSTLPAAQAAVHEQGWHLELRWPRSAFPTGRALRLGLAVNERPPRRERRRGQLVLGGASGFAYLRGDRLDPSESWTLTLP